MGCHTWSYVKVTALTEKEKQNKVNAEIKVLTNWWGFKESSKSIAKEVNSWKKEYPELSEKIGDPKTYARNLVNEYTTKLNNLKEYGFKAYKEQKLEDSVEFKLINGEYYVYVSCDDPFRVYGYPEQTFTNKESLLQWLQSLEPQMYGCYVKDRFVEGYTDGLVQNINKFFSKYGEDNCYFEFG